MDISGILVPSAVKVVATISSKKRLFHELGEIAQASYGYNAETTVLALQERESLGATGVGGGVALPHARVEGIETLAGAFLRLEKPMEFAAVDRQQVDLVFALFAPADAGVEHLKALARISRTLRDTELCGKLRANSDPAALHAMLTESQGIRAA